MEKNNAGINPSIKNPSTIDATNIIIKAFTTRLKRPRVIKFIGSVNKTKNGLMKIFTKPKIRAVQRADQGPSMKTPGM